MTTHTHKAGPLMFSPTRKVWGWSADLRFQPFTALWAVQNLVLLHVILGDASIRREGDYLVHPWAAVTLCGMRDFSDTALWYHHTSAESPVNPPVYQAAFEWHYSSGLPVVLYSTLSKCLFTSPQEKETQLKPLQIHSPAWSHKPVIPTSQGRGIRSSVSPRPACVHWEFQAS